jgi:hypothetical protein
MAEQAQVNPDMMVQQMQQPAFIETIHDKIHGAFDAVRSYVDGHGKEVAAAALAVALPLGAIACGGSPKSVETNGPSATSVSKQGNVPTTAPGEVCINDTTQVKYFADDAPEGSHRFGPSPSAEALSDANVAYADLLEDLCGGGDKQADPAKMIGLREYFGLEFPQDSDTRDALVAQATHDKAVWEAKTQQLIDVMNTYDHEVEIVDNVVYKTEYMLPNTRPEGRPGIYQSDEHMVNKMVLKFTRKDNQGQLEVKRLKGECDWQPADVELPPSIPQLPPEAPSQPTTPEQPTIPHNPTLPKRPTTTPPAPTTTRVGPKDNEHLPTNGGIPGEAPTTVPIDKPQGEPTPTLGPRNPNTTSKPQDTQVPPTGIPTTTAPDKGIPNPDLVANEQRN